MSNEDYSLLNDKDLCDLVNPFINKGGIPYKAVLEHQKRFPQEYSSKPINSADPKPNGYDNWKKGIYN